MTNRYEVRGCLGDPDAWFIYDKLWREPVSLDSLDIELAEVVAKTLNNRADASPEGA